MEYLGFAASLTMGIILGLMGGGGSILTVPIMVYLFSLTPSLATGYSLFVVGMTALIGGLVHLRKGEIDFQAGIIFAVPSIAGVNLSRALILPSIPTVIAEFGRFTLSRELLVMLSFAILMVMASASMIRRKNPSSPVRDLTYKGGALLALQGLIVGLIVGFVGAGGGFLIIPALVLMAGLQMRIAVGTSLMVIAFQSLLGFAADTYRGLSVNWLLLGTITIFAVLGIVLGSAFSHKVNERKLKSAFGYFVLVMGTGILLEQLFHIST